MLSRFPPLLYTRVINQIAHRPLDRAPGRLGQDALAMREIHSFKNIEQTIKECAEPKFGDSVEIGERMCAAQKNCRHLRVVVETFGQVAPLLRESVDCRLPPLFGLLA